jgi:hypothetical protein
VENGTDCAIAAIAFLRGVESVSIMQRYPSEPANGSAIEWIKVRRDVPWRVLKIPPCELCGLEPAATWLNVPRAVTRCFECKQGEDENYVK